MKKEQCIHKYQKRKYGKGLVFKCQAAGCNHFIAVNLAEGRIATCWRCDGAFVMDRRAMKLTRPHCLTCVKGYKPDSVEKTEKIDKLKEFVLSIENPFDQ